MKLGILADIHEEADNLRQALATLMNYQVDRFIVLGDVFELGKRLEETVQLLAGVEAVGVWGNHDFGLCRNPGQSIRTRFPESILSFMGSLRPRLDIEGFLFTHVEPWLDAEKIEDLWWFEGIPDTPERLSQSFRAVPHRVMFVGHFHRWFLADANGLTSWCGEGPVLLDPDRRFLAGIGAVSEGCCGCFDTDSNLLVPFSVERRVLGIEGREGGAN
jgi:hypothetical protein